MIALKPQRGDIKKSQKNQKIYVNAKNGKYFQPFVRVENLQPLLEPFEQPLNLPNKLNH
jgi:hypothetical protein